MPYITGQLEKVSRVDLVWDSYLKNSLKSQTRKKRGKDNRIRVEGSNCIPTNWKQFLRVDENKTQLFSFLSKHVSQIVSLKQVVATHGPIVLCTQPQDTIKLAPCKHEEADTSMLLHTADAVSHGFERITLCTVDTDVVVLAVIVVPQIAIKELWIAFWTGQHLWYIL